MGIKSEDTSPQMTAASSTASASIPSVAHTPGPWVMMADSLGTVETADGKIIVAQAMQVAAVRVPTDHAVRQANACLIAAAPGLLKALKPLAALPLGDEIITERDLVLYANAGKSITVGDVLVARAAIAKAQITDGAAPATSQGQAVQNLTDPASPSPKEER